MDASFPKSHRLLKRKDFLRVGRSGRRVYTRDLVVVVSPRPRLPARLGITVGRRVGKAVLRNRIKRMIREYFRTHRNRFPTGFDLVVIVKSSAHLKESRDVERNFEQFFRKYPPRQRSQPGGGGGHRPH